MPVFAGPPRKEILASTVMKYLGTVPGSTASWARLRVSAQHCCYERKPDQRLFCSLRQHVLYEKRYCLESKRTKGRARLCGSSGPPTPMPASHACRQITNAKRKVAHGRVNFPRHSAEAAEQTVPWLKPQRERETQLIHWHPSWAWRKLRAPLCDPRVTEPGRPV